MLGTGFASAAYEADGPQCECQLLSACAMPPLPSRSCRCTPGSPSTQRMLPMALHRVMGDITTRFLSDKDPNRNELNNFSIKYISRSHAVLEYELLKTHA